jgi:hypothetical protein
MLKTVTLEDEEIEILLFYRKETLANLKKEIEALVKKHNHNEKRLNELTGLLGHESETSNEDHLAPAHLHEHGSPAAEISHEPEAVHHHNGETSHEGEHQQEIETFHHQDGEALHEEGHSHENETVHHHDNETQHQ